MLNHGEMGMFRCHQDAKAVSPRLYLEQPAQHYWDCPAKNTRVRQTQLSASASRQPMMFKPGHGVGYPYNHTIPRVEGSVPDTSH